MKGDGAKDLRRLELIGLDAAVIEASNRANIGIKGRVIDETKNTLTIMHQGRAKRLLKSCVRLEISRAKKTYWVDGRAIAKRHHERLMIR